MSRPRVAFVLHVMQVAGAEVLVSETIARLGDRIVPHVFCLDAVGPLGEKLIAQGVPVISFDRRPGTDWSIVWRMAREIRSRAIDVVHAHQYTPFFYSALAARLGWRVPRVILTEHGRHYPDIVSAKRQWFNRLFFCHLADRITAVCEFSADSLGAVDGFPRDRISIIPNGIAVDSYEPSIDCLSLKARLGLQPERRCVICIARFHPVKDHRTLVAGFTAVAARLPDVDLVLVGDGALRGEIEAQIAAANLRSRVRMLGVRADVPDLLKAADVFALSSVSEAASITLLEAMACGLPVVVTAVGGNPELVREGVDGILVPRGDADAFGRAFLALFEQPQLRAQMGRAGASRVRERFRLEQAIDAYACLYAGA